MESLSIRIHWHSWYYGVICSSRFIFYISVFLEGMKSRLPTLFSCNELLKSSNAEIKDKIQKTQKSLLNFDTEDQLALNRIQTLTTEESKLDNKLNERRKIIEAILKSLNIKLDVSHIDTSDHEVYLDCIKAFFTNSNQNKLMSDFKSIYSAIIKKL